MTLYELSLEYSRSAQLLWSRISELEHERRETADEGRRTLLEARVRPLRGMYRETRAMARKLENYYHKFTPREDKRPAAGSGFSVDHRRRK